MKIRRASFFLAGLCAFGLSAMLCLAADIATQPGTPSAAPKTRANELLIDKKRATFAFEQDQRAVEPDKDGVVHLKPRAFVIRLTGDKQDVSLLTVRNSKQLEAFKKHPAYVTSVGSYQACPDTELLITPDGPAIAAGDDIPKLQEHWVRDAGEAKEVAKQLREKMGEVPTLLFSGRQCLKEDDADAFKIAQLVVDDKDRAIQAGDALEVVIFLDSPLDQDFNKAVWKSVRLVFDQK